MIFYWVLLQHSQLFSGFSTVHRALWHTFKKASMSPIAGMYSGMNGLSLVSRSMVWGVYLVMCWNSSFNSLLTWRCWNSAGSYTLHDKWTCTHIKCYNTGCAVCEGGRKGTKLKELQWFCIINYVISVERYTCTCVGSKLCFLMNPCGMVLGYII